MLEILLYNVVNPITIIALFAISLYRYVSAKKQNKVVPGTFSDAEIKKRKIMLIVMSVIAGVLVAIVIGIIVLMSMSIAHM